MSWISIDTDECTACGVCITRCPQCFSDKEGDIITKANEKTCNLCGHCVALCPTAAITHSEMDMQNFLELDTGLPFEPEPFFHFIRGRRSHRSFEDRPIPKGDLEKLVDLCRYAPTGSNRQGVGLIVIQDRDRIKRLSDYTVDFFENHVDELIREAKEYEAGGMEVPQTTKSALTMLDGLALLVRARKFGFEVIFHNAPVVMIFHSTTETSTPKDDCVIASTTITLAARALSLETCYIGLFEFVANRYEPIVEELNLPPGHKVFSILILGYPTMTFFRTVDRKPMRVQWM